MPSAKLKHPREPSAVSSENPRKRTKLLLDGDTSDEGDLSDVTGGVGLELDHTHVPEPGFKVNKEYARRFEHNQRRAEIHRCTFSLMPFAHFSFIDTIAVEEKYGKSSTTTDHESSKMNGFSDEEGSDSSSDEEEDDEGILASGILDDQVNATLEAIRKKDPRVYDEKVTFYSKSDDDEEDDHQSVSRSKEKPMYLNDYHRENLLRGVIVAEEEDAGPPTYAQEQDQLKDAIVKEMHAAAQGVDAEASSASSDGSDDGTDFLVRKRPSLYKADSSIAKPELGSVDVRNAEKDPETFLSNFMSARAWVPATQSRFQPFESDDEEEDRRAEAFEEAYNLRFENPQVSNEKLLSIARDTAAKYSVRKEATNSRKRAREAEQATKEAQKQDRVQEKAQLRRLRLEEAAEKIKKIKEAAGLRGKALAVEDWSEFLTEDWDDERWDTEMRNRFGDRYYADEEHDDSGAETSKQKKKLKKPKWEDDIDIADLVPDFDTEEATNVRFSLSDDSEPEGSNAGVDLEDIEAERAGKKRKSVVREREDLKKESRQERRKVEQLVNEKLNIDFALNDSGSRRSKSGPFRYRETSPLAFGLTAHDILMASDGQLNQYAGLKKMAAFRDVSKKKKDKKHLGKKARLRQWRKETFGDEQGPRKSLQNLLAEELPTNDQVIPQDIDATKEKGDRGKKRKRSKKNKEAVSAG
ncbi:KRRI-Interacting protein 1 [Xylographa bjoerkii]|nr:KRRI-Interacting protein 1 [Xylographa bjoerkii]